LLFRYGRIHFTGIIYCTQCSIHWHCAFHLTPLWWDCHKYCCPRPIERYGQLSMRGQAKKRVPKECPWASNFNLSWTRQLNAHNSEKKKQHKMKIGRWACG
jgi:hypothetical protein